MIVPRWLAKTHDLRAKRAAALYLRSAQKLNRASSLIFGGLASRQQVLTKGHKYAYAENISKGLETLSESIKEVSGVCEAFGKLPGAPGSAKAPGIKKDKKAKS